MMSAAQPMVSNDRILCEYELERISNKLRFSSLDDSIKIFIYYYLFKLQMGFYPVAVVLQ
jgi:hypothetical protein